MLKTAVFIYDIQKVQIFTGKHAWRTPAPSLFCTKNQLYPTKRQKRILNGAFHWDKITNSISTIKNGTSLAFLLMKLSKFFPRFSICNSSLYQQCLLSSMHSRRLCELCSVNYLSISLRLFCLSLSLRIFFSYLEGRG